MPQEEQDSRPTQQKDKPTASLPGSIANTSAQTSPTSSTLLFVPELDDDMQSLTILGRKGLLRRLYAYFLLADGILVHPAYLWQSTISHELMLERLCDLFGPDFVKLALGDSGSTRDYIANRISVLQNSAHQSSELRTYGIWKKQIHIEAAKIDRRFSNRSHFQTKESRDSAFRRLLSSDLDNQVDPESLFNQICRYSEKYQLKLDVQECRTHLKTSVEKSELVTTEIFSISLHNQGLAALAESNPLKKRLLAIYYLANVDPGIHIPALAQLGPASLIDPYDADTFWAVFKSLFGKKAYEVFAHNDDPEFIRAMMRLRESETWQGFQQAYFSVLALTSDAINVEAAEIVKKILQQSGLPEHFIIRNLWREHRLSILSAIFTVVGATTGLGILSAVTAAASLLFGLGKLPSDIARFVDDYNSHDIAKIKVEIRREVRNYIVKMKNAISST